MNPAALGLMAEGMIAKNALEAVGGVVTFINEVRDNARVGRIIQIDSGDYHE